MVGGADKELESLLEEDTDEKLPGIVLPGEVRDMASPSVLSLVERLTDSNYLVWSFKVEHLLKREDLWTFVETTPQNLSPARKEADDRALATIVLFLSDSQLVYMRSCTSMKQAWDALKAVHA